jgi:antitoxin HicB
VLLYPFVIYPTPEDGGYFAVVPDLRGCAAHDETAEEAVREAQVAMLLGLEVAREDGDPLPEPSPYPLPRAEAS